jgi:V/A-type H+-transporting ATPase subunit F
MKGDDFLVIGEPELLVGFGFVGVRGLPCFERDDTLAAFRSACADGVRVLIVSQDVAGLIRDELVAWQLGGQCPLVVELPPLAGPVAGQKSLVELIRAAIGIHV